MGAGVRMQEDGFAQDGREKEQDFPWTGGKMGDGGEREKMPLLLPVHSASKI